MHYNWSLLKSFNNDYTLRKEILAVWKFRSILIRSFWKQFLNFVVRPKYCISRHFNFVVWSKYYNLRHFNFAAVLKIEFFMCVGIQHFTNLEKSRCLNARLNTFLSFFTNYWFKKSIKNTRKICGKPNIKKSIFAVLFFYRWIFKGFFRPILNCVLVEKLCSAAF